MSHGIMGGKYESRGQKEGQMSRVGVTLRDMGRCGERTDVAIWE